VSVCENIFKITENKSKAVTTFYKSFTICASIRIRPNGKTLTIWYISSVSIKSAVPA